MTENEKDPTNSPLVLFQAGTRVLGGLAEVALASARTSVQNNVNHNPVLALGVQLAGLAEDLVTGARDDPNMVLDLVRAEVERSVGRLGLATTAELDVLKQRVVELEREVASLQRQQKPPTKKAPARKAPVIKAAATKETAKKAAAEQPVVNPTVPRRPSAKTAAAQQKSAEATPPLETPATGSVE